MGERNWDEPDLKPFHDAVKQFFPLVLELSSGFVPRRTSNYVGLAASVAFITFRPHKGKLRIDVLIDDPDGWSSRLQAHNITVLNGLNHEKIKFLPGESLTDDKRGVLRQLFQAAYKRHLATMVT
jgi:hypothetical protein